MTVNHATHLSLVASWRVALNDIAGQRPVVRINACAPRFHTPALDDYLHKVEFFQ